MGDVWDLPELVEYLVPLEPELSVSILPFYDKIE